MFSRLRTVRHLVFCSDDVSAPATLRRRGETYALVLGSSVRFLVDPRAELICTSLKMTMHAMRVTQRRELDRASGLRLEQFAAVEPKCEVLRPLRLKCWKLIHSMLAEQHR